MGQGPAAFGVHPGVEVLAVLIQQFLRPEAVKPQQPVCLVEAVLPQEGRLCVPGGQQGVFYHRDVSGIEHPFQSVAVIETLGQPEDVEVRVLGGSHNELGTLSSGGEAGGVAEFHQFLPALPVPGLDLPHGGQNGPLCLVRGQGLQPCLRGQLDVHTEAVRQKPEPFHQFRRRSGDGLGVDIAVEAVLLPEEGQGTDHQFRGVVRAAEDPGGEEQPLDIVPPVKLDGQVRQFLRGEGRPPGLVAPAVDTVLAVVYAAVGQQHLEQCDATSIGGEGVAASRQGGGGVADIPLLRGPGSPAGGTGGVILGGVGENGQLLQDVHGFSRRISHSSTFQADGRYALRERRAGRSIRSMRRNSWAVRIATPRSVKNRVQPVIWKSPLIENLFEYYYKSNNRSCQGGK